MPQMSRGNEVLGVGSLLMCRPETAEPLCDLAGTPLRGPGLAKPGVVLRIAAALQRAHVIVHERNRKICLTQGRIIATAGHHMSRFSRYGLVAVCTGNSRSF